MAIIEGKPIKLESYVVSKADGKEECPFDDWFFKLDKGIGARVAKRLDRVREGNPGDHRWLQDGLLELRLDFGSGYRIYAGDMGDQLVILLAGGSKSNQQKDMETARNYWTDYRQNDKRTQ